MSRKVTIHMVASLDGFIAKHDGSVDWMQTNDNFPDGDVLSEEEISQFLAGIDCYVMGSKTYEHALALGWPYGDTPVIVLTSRRLESMKSNVKFQSGNLKLVLDSINEKQQNIWVVGGASLVKDFIQQKLANEIVITFLPIILGGGIPFFQELAIEQPLHLVDSRTFQGGTVELTYEIIK